jgi:hypothetical protein
MMMHKTLWIIGVVELSQDGYPNIVSAFTSSFPWEETTVNLKKRYVNITSIKAETLEECERIWGESLATPMFSWVKALLEQ